MLTNEERVQFEKLASSSIGMINSRQYPGIKKTLSSLYPDKNHFIYELLQNAEDAGATQATFLVENDKLIFEHNGSKAFDINDIDAITNIGFSTKIEEDSKAGQFGVGFKSVYAYTETPYIYTRHISFKIESMYVPIELPDVDMDENVTRFVFPYDNPKLPPEQAVTKIENGLRDIDSTTLLFLDNLRNITYTLSNNKMGIIEATHNNRTDSSKFIHCESIFDDGKIGEPSDWLRFDKQVIIDIDDEKINKKKSKINVAYPIVIENKTYKFVEPKEKGCVSIFFVAKNTRSNLKFYINAPFGCTPARDAICETPQNDALITDLSLLIEESIINLRDANELTPSFYNIMPLISDYDSEEMFSPISRKVHHIFSSEKVILTDNGYQLSKNSIRCNDDIRKMFSIEDIRKINNGRELYFAKNIIGQADRFLDGIGVIKDDFDSIFNKIKSLPVDITNQLFDNRNSDWCLKIYSRFNKNVSVEDSVAFRKTKIVRTNKQIMVIPQNACFLQQGISLPKDKFEVDADCYSSSKDARRFLEMIGVKEYTQSDKDREIKEKGRASLEQQLEKVCNIEDSIQAIKKVIEYIRSGKQDSNPIQFNKYKFIWSKLNNLEQLASPCQCAIDSPYIETGFASATHIHEKMIVSEIYDKRLEDYQKKFFIEFLKNNGAMSGFVIESSPSVWEHPKSYELWNSRKYQRITVRQSKDWFIKNISKYLGLKNKSINRLIWNAIMNNKILDTNRNGWDYDSDIYQNPTIAFYRFQMSSEARNTDYSSIVYALRNTEWILTKTGEMKKPCDVVHAQIDDSFVWNSSSLFIEALEIGRKQAEAQERAKRESETAIFEKRKKDENAQAEGYSSWDELMRCAEKGKQADSMGEDFDKALAKSKRKSFPTAKTVNPQKRQDFANQQALEATEATYVMKERSVRQTNGQDDGYRSTMLRNYYTNEDGEMFCQICKQEMPFKKKNGEYYFEQVELDDRNNRRFRETNYHYIALCPTCRAKFEEWVRNSRNKHAIYNIVEDIITKNTIDGEDGNERVSVEMDGNQEYTIEFVQKHIEDIRGSLIK